MKKLRMIVLDDYEGELASAPAMLRLQQLADVKILDRPIEPDDHHILKHVKVLLALRERTTLDSRFFDACPNLELILQTGGHDNNIDKTAATRHGIITSQAMPEPPRPSCALLWGTYPDCSGAGIVPRIPPRMP